jgi:putative tryptophan/tyrosine transport system substrate-binding protein
MRRREFITLLGGAAVTWPLAARAQQPQQRVRRIGVLMTNAKDDSEAQHRIRALNQGLEKLGWAPGHTVRIDYRFSVVDSDRTRSSAAELVALAPDVILAHTPAMVDALKQATNTIPIVFVQASDPVSLGLVTGLSHPTGNVTGFVLFEPSLAGKWLQVLHEVSPGITRVLVLQGAANPSSAGYLRSLQAVASSPGVSLQSIEVRDAVDIERAVSTVAAFTNSGLIVLPSPISTAQRELIITLAARHRLPAVYPFRFFVTAGGLMFYGANNIDQWRQAASYVDRIFWGAQPRDLPIQLPTKFELVINLKTAKSLGLEVPAKLLALADEVIE